MHRTSLLLQETFLGRQIFAILEEEGSGNTHPADLSLSRERATSWGIDARLTVCADGRWRKICHDLNPLFEDGGEGSPSKEEIPRKPTLSVSYPWPTTSVETGYTQVLELCLYEESGLAYKSLLWKLLFKGITVIEFIIFDELLKRRWRQLPEEKQLVVAFLTFLSLGTRKGLIDLNSSTKPIFNRLPPKFLLRFKSEKPVDEIIAFLGLPRRGRTVACTHAFKTRRIRKPRTISRIGVGYKDKGSMGEPDRLSPDQVLDFSIPPSGGRYERDFLSVLHQAKSFWLEPG